MKTPLVLTTKRLTLRPWREDDLVPFAKMNADRRVMEYFPAIKTLEETTGEYNRIVENFSKHGWGLWAAEVCDQNEFIGFIGLHPVSFIANFTPCVEIGWRLRPEFWGKGLATEGALAALKAGFVDLHLDEIVSFTAVSNVRSQAVMKNIGMHHDSKDDFDHPKLDPNHPLCRHVLYRLTRDEWNKDK